jgi:hypothetical protein
VKVDHGQTAGGTWTCIGSPPTAGWKWWGDCGGEAWAVADAAGEDGAGYFDSIRAVHVQWSEAERASFTLTQQDAANKNSSTLQELRVLGMAVADWVRTDPAVGAVFNYFTDAQNLPHVMRRGRSSIAVVNGELRRIHLLLAPRALGVRVHWNPREALCAKMADSLSRGLFAEFQRLDAESAPARLHPCLRFVTRSSPSTGPRPRR